jgi:phosphoribosylformimino-5-aminoimidazole carboxamide ribotide isomerase
MYLLPAIDLRNGRCVRLLKGDFDRETRYEVDPVELAGNYRASGADWLHVVDLDGAASGAPVNLGIVANIKERHGLRLQLGGGIRSRDNLVAALEVADRIVLGSLAVSQPEQVMAWMGEFGPERFTLGFDVRIREQAPYLTTHGWTRDSDIRLADAIERYIKVGLQHVLCTDVDKDGALSGPNFALYSECCDRWPDLAFQASGGIRDAGDLERLVGTGVAAAISGKALLEGLISEEEIRRFLPNG